MRCPACDTDNIQGVDVCESCGSDLAGLDLPEAAGGQLGRLLTDRLGDVGTAAALTIDGQESVAAAIRAMREARSGCILVLSQGQLTGIFNERDVLTRVVRRGLDPEAVAVTEVMRPEPTCLSPEDPPAYAVHCMVSRDLRHLPVVSGSDILGVVSVRNILAYLSRDALADGR